jgi:hypothetical protein
MLLREIFIRIHFRCSWSLWSSSKSSSDDAVLYFFSYSQLGYIIILQFSLHTSTLLFQLMLLYFLECFLHWFFQKHFKLRTNVFLEYDWLFVISISLQIVNFQSFIKICLNHLKKVTTSNQSTKNDKLWKWIFPFCDWNVSVNTFQNESCFTTTTN